MENKPKAKPLFEQVVGHLAIVPGVISFGGIIISVVLFLFTVLSIWQFVALLVAIMTLALGLDMSIQELFQDKKVSYHTFAISCLFVGSSTILFGWVRAPSEQLGIGFAFTFCVGCLLLMIKE